MKKRLDRLSNASRKVLLRFINARYSLPTWLWVLASTFVGFLVFQYSLVKDPEVAQFAEALPFGGIVWGGLLTLAGLSSMIAMARHKNKHMRHASMTSFILWIFGAIAFAQDGIANVLIFAGPMVLFWAYKYLATFVREFPRL
jgi:hypothetical protein